MQKSFCEGSVERFRHSDSTVPFCLRMQYKKPLQKSISTVINSKSDSKQTNKKITLYNKLTLVPAIALCNYKAKGKYCS